MKIGLDIRQSKVEGTGIGRYTMNIYARLQELKRSELIFIDGPANKGSAIIDKLVVNLWEQFVLPVLLLIKRVKVFHITKNLGIPLISFTRYIITVHDIIPLIMQKEYLPGKLKKLLYVVRLKWAVKRADILVSDSFHTKEDLIKHLGVPASKIRVIYLGIEKKFRVSDDFSKSNDIWQRYGISKPFILGLGSNEPRKNTANLIKAFEIIKEGHSSDLQLVIIGKPWSKQRDGYDCSEDIIFTGYVGDEELIALYNSTEVFVFPSLYEGFGLPPLEAMACGAPVITSNTSSLPEVVGDSAVLVDPNNIEQIANSIWKIVTDREYRSSLKQKGLEHVKQFTWEKSIKELAELYDEYLKR